MALLGKIKNKKLVLLFFFLPFLALFCIQSCSPDSKKKETKKEKKASVNSLDVKKNNIKIIQFNADSAYYFVKEQVDFGPRVPNSLAHQNCHLYLKNKLENYGARVIIQEDTVRRFDGEILNMKNIIGSFNTDKKNRILLCAHWDSRYVADQDTDRVNDPIDGANDGGSGVGVLLEIARQMNTNAPNIGIDIIFFDVEDQGEGGEGVDNPLSWCLGSQYWSTNLHVANYQARYGILLDMVGGPNAVFIPDYHSKYYAPELVDKVWKKGIEGGYMDYFELSAGEDYFLLDDHVMINEISTINGRHIPTIDIIEYDNSNDHTFNEHWHTHDDNMENIDKNTLKAVGQTVLNVIYNE